MTSKDYPEKSIPCQYTLEELNECLDRAEEDVRAGRYYTTEDIRKIRPQWKLK